MERTIIERQDKTVKKTVFTGSGVAIITPFTENGVNYDVH